MAKKPEPVEPNTPEEWAVWKEFAADARELMKQIKCDYPTALLLLALNEVVQTLQRPDDDEPWRGGKSK
jgi:hypothetical protein